MEGANIHCGVHLIDGKIAMNIFHCFTSSLHGVQCFLIDVRSLNAIYLLFDLCDLIVGLLEAALVDFLPSKRGFRSCDGNPY
jgi:hypothetical protein